MCAARRLAAVLFADVAEYSHRMNVNETETHRELIAVINHVWRPEISRWQGCVVRTTGDGLLCVFDSAVGAVGCATAVQRQLLERNGGRVFADALLG